MCIRDRHYNQPDVLLALHHLVVCALTYTMGFCDMPGVVFYAFATAVVELGTSAYCGWTLWKFRKSYYWVMNLSNLVPVVGCGMCVHRADPLPTHLLVGFVSFCGLVVGRTAVMMAELKKHPISGHTKTM
eukprot:TRINITY_DN11365_c0_g1_i3.p2 TRINITY_DN11365_c0_g1~~TRINITY_DN11365_c0_g1_i3.p2  ORF type:complete len:130 (+),score=24.56 TRINITY_DN11365_c0_g1_i3:107-496(+)